MSTATARPLRVKLVNFVIWAWRKRLYRIRQGRPDICACLLMPQKLGHIANTTACCTASRPL